MTLLTELREKVIRNKEIPTNSITDELSREEVAIIIVLYRCLRVSTKLCECFYFFDRLDYRNVFILCPFPEKKEGYTEYV